MLCSALRPALPCPALPCHAMPCPALQLARLERWSMVAVVAASLLLHLAPFSWLLDSFVWLMIELCCT